METKKPAEGPPIRRITEAPPPATELSGLGLRAPSPEPSEAPANFPAYYPNALKVRTAAAITAAGKASPYKSQIFDMCRRVISKLTPAFCAEVQAGRVRADLAPGNMRDLLRSLLVCNVSYDRERYRLEQELKRSKQWSSFIRRLNKAERDANKPRNKRRSFVMPRLEQKGWSVLDWAKESQVDYHTATGYLEGKTEPYPSTRGKLAHSLGLSVENLPD